MLHTTYNFALKAGACGLNDKVRALTKFKYRGGLRKWGKDYPIPLIDVLEVLGIHDALWCLRCCTDSDKARLLSQIFACDCAEHIETAYRGYIRGEATRDELSAIRAAAWAADWAAARADARYARAARDAEREWQSQRFIELLEK